MNTGFYGEFYGALKMLVSTISMTKGKMVGRDGFEPSTNWLKANCSTAELTALRRGAYHTDQRLKFKRYFDISLGPESRPVRSPVDAIDSFHICHRLHLPNWPGNRKLFRCNRHLKPILREQSALLSYR